MDKIYQAKHLRRQVYTTDRNEEEKILAKLNNRTDIEAERLKRYVALPDLSRTVGSPIYELVEQVKKLPLFANFDDIDIPEVVSAKTSFDLFNFAPNHPARSHSDTYYIDDEHILRTHDTVMWNYYLNDPKVKAKIAAQEPLGVLCYGKVYRKDEIDRRHLNVFHQMGGLYLVPNEKQIIVFDDLKKVLTDITLNLFGPQVNLRFNPDTFPYTDPSLEIEVETSNQWVEILGGGLPRPEVLANFGLRGYNGWAFGFGLERLAILSMALPDIRLLWSDDPRVKNQLKLGQKYEAVSKYPPVVRDISFVVPNTFILNNYFDLIRETVGDDFIEEAKLLDHYVDETKFGKDKTSFTFRIIYRRLDRTLTNEEVDKLHRKLENITTNEFRGVIR